MTHCPRCEASVSKPGLCEKCRGTTSLSEAMAAEIDARLHDSASPARTEIIAAIIDKHFPAPEARAALADAPDIGPDGHIRIIRVDADKLYELATTISETRAILAGSDVASLPHDYPLQKMAEDRMADINGAAGGQPIVVIGRIGGSAEVPACPFESTIDRLSKTDAVKEE